MFINIEKKGTSGGRSHERMDQDYIELTLFFSKTLVPS